MISFETVTATWKNIGQMSMDEAESLAAQMNTEQPIALYYLLSLQDMPFTTAEHELIHYVGIVVWQIMLHSDQQLYHVTEESLERAQEANARLLDQLASSSGPEFVAACQRLIRTHPEPEVLRYIVETLVTAESEDFPGRPALRAEAQGMAFIQLKILLDAMVACLGPRPPLVA